LLRRRVLVCPKSLESRNASAGVRLRDGKRYYFVFLSRTRSPLTGNSESKNTFLCFFPGRTVGARLMICTVQHQKSRKHIIVSISDGGLRGFELKSG
jgi:hypothetical protein